MALAIWTALAMLAFAGNSILTRMAVGAGAIDALSFALIRLMSGAVILALVMLWRKQSWPALRGRGQAVLGLLVYLFGFSAAYVSLSAGTGALILFGMVQVTMFGGRCWRVRPWRSGAGRALAWPWPDWWFCWHPSLLWAGCGRCWR